MIPRMIACDRLLQKYVVPLLQVNSFLLRQPIDATMIKTLARQYIQSIAFKQAWN